jgi:hypothetical protein
MATTPNYSPVVAGPVKFASETSTDGGLPASFDYFLSRENGVGGRPVKLTIKLRVNLRPRPPMPFPQQRDADNKMFYTAPWNAADWANFLRAANAEANMWNDKFWLTPPRTFADFDQDLGSFPIRQMYRPNICCELDVDFTATKDDAHATVDVVNIDIGRLPIGGRRDAATFRSNAVLWDSLDGVPMLSPYGTGPGLPDKNYCIAHEIGHLIGLAHMGVLLKRPMCEFAIAQARMGFDGYATGTSGGANGLYCYGWGDGIDVSGNIMGAGRNWSKENAKPWLWTIGSILIRQNNGLNWPKVLADLSKWQVVMSNPGAGNIVS